MNKLDSVLEILKKEGMKEEQIGEFVTNLNNTIAQKTHLEIISALSEEDLAEIETAKEDEVNVLIAELYEQRTGKSVEEIGDSALDTFIETFQANYERRKTQQRHPSDNS